MLLIFGGLPGTGKSTLAKEIAHRLQAVYLRVDTAEQALKQSPHFSDSVGPEGYLVCYAIAADNLALGLHVVADSVNPLAITRESWQKVALSANTPFVEIELICSDTRTHQHRVETRKADIPGHQLPAWKEVINRDYQQWSAPSLKLDTSRHSVEECIEMIMNLIH
ncbi:putative adenylyl-sulfate kinase [Legionella geestiana]|uniref:Putative adenylyl-sulfate kinase n=1 Tax=Legionella geestiana TaxID=45065 RepID=A0A0W0U3N7_9GAMM|nr:AAA family ATPase [Legionella geestiana]KTD02383.1 putative adenylyl-sulfate kinase [Legionella geestiana]QBS12143.1 AAA family ATPase [Legionella geestiana]QDQ40146.1 AAA family ATPase [Legionella geestiana]STX53129.1 L-seryl-tRNA(Sec) kinase [Legionella geestiana]